MQGELFDAEGRAYRSQFGLASFVHRRIAVERQVEAFVHGAYRADGWGRPPVPRNLHGMRLRDPASGRAFAVAQFHGLRDLAGKHDTPARQAQATRVRDLLSEVCREGEAAVLCGDFNLLPDSESFGIWREAGLRDLVTGNGFADTRTSLYEKDQRFADYLLVSDAVKVLRFDVPAEPEVSDHRPLVLEFDIGA